jgi:hypothetical protein
MEKLLQLLTTPEVIARANEKDADLKSIATEITANIAASAQNNSEFVAKIRKEQHGRALVEVTKAVTKAFGLTKEQLEEANVPTDDYTKILELGKEMTANAVQSTKVAATNDEQTKALQKAQDAIRDLTAKEKIYQSQIEQTKASASKEITNYKTQTALAQAIAKTKTTLSTTAAADLMKVRLEKYKVEFDANNAPVVKTTEGTDIYNDKSQKINTLEELISWELRDVMPTIHQTGNEGKTILITPVDKTKLTAEQQDFHRKMAENFTDEELTAVS